MRMIIVLTVLASLFACDQLEEPRKVNELPAGDTPFHVVVSNQSFDIDPVDIDVYVDEMHIITGDFEVGSQHTFLTFDFSTSSGTHALRAVGDGEEITLEQSFEVPAETWGVLMFWYYAQTEGGHEADPAHFAWTTQQTRPMFD